jgi:hypothetical protein
MALYNYFREKWLVDRLANSVADAFGQEPLGHVHQQRAYLAVMLAGPRLAELKQPPPLPELVFAYGQARDPSPAHVLQRDRSVAPATDDWPFLYMRDRRFPRHYLAALAVVLAISAIAVGLVTARSRESRGLIGLATPGADGLRRSAHFFLLGAGFMLLETKSIVQFALLWGSTWSSASLAIVSVLTMALFSTMLVARVQLRRRWPIAIALIALLAANYALPIGTIAFGSRLLESTFYGTLVFSPVLCAGLLFSASFKRSPETAADFGSNLFGAMIGGIGEYLSLVAGYRFLLLLVAGCYLVAVAMADSSRVTE